MIQQIIANNRAGGWRSIKKAGQVSVDPSAPRQSRT